MAKLRTAANVNTDAAIRSALGSLMRFADGPARERELFRKPHVHGEVDTQAYNEWSLLLWAEWLVTTPSPKTGKPLKAASIASYISLAKNELSIQFGFEVVTMSESRLKRLIKQLRAMDPVADRRKRRGLRGRHLRRAYKKLGYDKDDSRRAVNEWAAVAVAREAVARGGELCKGRAGVAAMPKRSDVSFEHDRHGETATLWLRPLKKRGKAAAAKVPIVFAAYDRGGSDAYHALRRLFEHDPVPPAAAAATPLFRTGRGTPMTTDAFRKLVKDIAASLGFRRSEFGAHSPRIGGATDLGDESPLLLQAKGRWAGDIGKIYARLTRRGLVRASRAMQKRGAKDMEEIYDAFAQPA
jgi:hypothetical protein